ncbi:MAG: hypothetical protein V3T70_01340, partial [Phycisphaerae bacterium]
MRGERTRRALRIAAKIGLALCAGLCLVVVCSAFLHYRYADANRTFFFGRGQIIRTSGGAVDPDAFRPDQLGWHFDRASWNAYSWPQRLGLVLPEVRRPFWPYLLPASWLTLFLHLASRTLPRIRARSRAYRICRTTAVALTVLIAVPALVSVVLSTKLSLP